MFSNILKSMFGKAALATAVLGGALCFAGAPNAQADERDRGRDRDRIVRRDDYRVREDVRRGFYSPRARPPALRAARSDCPRLLRSLRLLAPLLNFSTSQKEKRGANKCAPFPFSNYFEFQIAR